MIPEITIPDLKKSKFLFFLDPKLKEISKKAPAENKIPAISNKILDCVNKFAPGRSITPDYKTND